MNHCAFCGKTLDDNEREDHHAIPRFLYKYFSIEGNPDLFRILLCKSCHSKFTKEWEKIRFSIKRGLYG